MVFLLVAARVCPGRSALQSAEQWCQRRYGHSHRVMVSESESESELAGPKAAPLGRKQKQFKICRSSIMQGENYKIPLH